MLGIVAIAITGIIISAMINAFGAHNAIQGTALAIPMLFAYVAFKVKLREDNKRVINLRKSSYKHHKKVIKKTA